MGAPVLSLTEKKQAYQATMSWIDWTSVEAKMPHAAVAGDEGCPCCVLKKEQQQLHILSILKEALETDNTVDSEQKRQMRSALLASVKNERQAKIATCATLTVEANIAMAEEARRKRSQGQSHQPRQHRGRATR
jgi:hypothetical protein